MAGPMGRPKMQLVNEALRMFLAISALILTAMLSTPSDETVLATHAKVVAVKNKTERKAASETGKIHFAFNRFRR